MNVKNVISSVAFVLLVAALASAQTLTGTVTNGTTGKPAAGAEVLLLDPMGGMTELAHGRTDAHGKFTLTPGPAKGPRLLRVPYQGVNYHAMVTPGMTEAKATVYEATKQMAELTMTVENAYQSDGTNLQGAVFYVIHNSSEPPRSVVSEKTFEFTVPQGAVVDNTDAQGPGGQPIPANAKQEGSTGRYTVDYPLRPGDTLVRVSYHLPYTSEATLSQKLSLKADRYTVVLPPSMTFEAKSSAAFGAAEQQQGLNLRTASNLAANQEVAYKLTGTGAMPDMQGSQGQEADSMGGGGAAQENRPGGGLGRQIEAPDSLAGFRVPLLIVLLVVLFGTAYLTLSRTSSAVVQAEKPSTDARAATVSESKSGNLLAAMKEELFQLELDRKQGKITQADYERHKAALDATLERALTRVTQNS